MPNKDRKPSRPDGLDATEGAEPGRVSRRSLLGAAGVGAAGLAAGAFAAASPALASTARHTARPDQAAADEGPDRIPADEPVVLHVANAHTGVIDVFAGTSHTKLRDPALAARLRRAAK